MRFLKYALFFLMYAMSLAIIANNSNLVVKTYQGIRPDDPNGRKGLLNPERGFRWCNRIGSFDPIWADSTWLSRITACANDGLTMTQAYCELLDYCELDQIPQNKLDKLQASFDAVRKAGVKLLLCFRYENGDLQNGPTLAKTINHIRQLKKIVNDNIDVIGIFQTGFIGMYGEWHRSYHQLDKDPEARKQVILEVLDILPPERKMLMRYPSYKTVFLRDSMGLCQNYYTPVAFNKVHTMAPEARIGYCDHGFMVGDSDAGTFPTPPSLPYSYMTTESLFVPMDGELFWSTSDPYGKIKDDGLVAIKRLWEHHYTLFGYSHNHSVYEGSGAAPDAILSIDEWKTDEVSKQFLINNHLPVSDGYFEDQNGNYVNRYIFEYIRDHLGYRLELKKCTYPASVTDGFFELEVELVNRGFDAPSNPREIKLVMFKESDKIVYEIGKADIDVRKLYPCDPVNRQQVSPVYSFSIKSSHMYVFPRGQYKLGIWMPDASNSIKYDSRYAIRFANREVPWWVDNNRYGINVIGEITLN